MMFFFFFPTSSFSAFFSLNRSQELENLRQFGLSFYWQVLPLLNRSCAGVSVKTFFPYFSNVLSGCVALSHASDDVIRKFLFAVSLTQNYVSVCARTANSKNESWPYFKCTILFCTFLFKLLCGGFRHPWKCAVVRVYKTNRLYWSTADIPTNSSQLWDYFFDHLSTLISYRDILKF